MIHTRVEAWLLWVYGLLVALLLPLMRLGDMVLTGSYETWYDNISYLLSTSLSVLLTGLLLFKAFRQPHGYIVTIGTTFAAWPLFWLSGWCGYLLVVWLNIYGYGSLLLYLLLPVVLITPFPVCLEYTYRRYLRMRQQNSETV